MTIISSSTTITTFTGLSPYLGNQTHKVFHATNAHWLYQNALEYNRYLSLFLETGKAILPPRLLDPGNSAEACDVITMFGNDFTKGTYGIYSDKVFHLPMSVSVKPEYTPGKNFKQAKKSFVWINSYGALLKGLDVVIEAFQSLPEYHLEICCDTDHDKEFLNLIATQVTESQNIRFVGWIDTDGSEFAKIIGNSAWVIGSSFSEGGGGSILNCMAKGLIPVLSKTMSICLPERTGFYFEENNGRCLANLIERIVSISEEDLAAYSVNAYNFILANHTLSVFKQRYKAFLENLVSGTPST